MKKFFTLITALFAMSTINAQNEPAKIGMTDPQLVQQFYDEYIMTFGVSADGRYVWGLVGGGDVASNILDIRNESEIIVLDPENEESLGVNVAGITYDGMAFVSEDAISYIYNISDAKKTYFKSPIEGYGMDIWNVSADGKFFAGNVTDDSGFFCMPLYGERQEDGSYKMTMLPVDEMDAMGAKAQFSQARFVTENGKYVMGLQAEARGMSNRMIVWEKQDDGTFVLTTPLDNIIYDMDAPKLGEFPEYEDYVTADPETEPELYKEQKENFYKVIDEFETAYGEFTRHCSLNVFGMHRALRGNCIYAGIEKQLIPDDPDGEIYTFLNPVVYNCETKEITVNDKIIGSAFEELPGGGYIVYDQSSGLYVKTSVVKKDGKTQEFTEWLNDMTGVNIGEDFYQSVESMTGELFEGVFAGFPYFSNDGKTLILSSVDSEFNLTTTVLDFDRDIFEGPGTGISNVNLLSKMTFKANTISIGDNKQGTAEIFGMNGQKQCDVAINGSLNLSGIVAPGSYIAKVKSNGTESVIKIVIK